MVQEKREKLDGKSVEDLGWFNPLLNKNEIKKERVLHWIKVGAQPTGTVHNLLVVAGIIAGKKIAVHKKSALTKGTKTKEGEAIAAPEAKAPETK